MALHEASKIDLQKPKKSMRIIRNVYLYLVSVIGLITFIFGAVGTINNVFQNYVFGVDYDYGYEVPYPKAAGTGCAASYLDPSDPAMKKMIRPTDAEIAECEVKMEQQKAQNHANRIGSEFSIAFAQLAVGLPIWLSTGIIQKEYRKKKKTKIYFLWEVPKTANTTHHTMANHGKYQSGAGRKNSLRLGRSH